MLCLSQGQSHSARIGRLGAQPVESRLYPNCFSSSHLFFCAPFRILKWLPLYTSFQTPVTSSLFPVPCSPLTVSRSQFPVHRFLFPVSFFPFPVSCPPFPFPVLVTSRHYDTIALRLAQGSAGILFKFLAI